MAYFPVFRVGADYRTQKKKKKNTFARVNRSTLLDDEGVFFLIFMRFYVSPNDASGIRKNVFISFLFSFVNPIRLSLGGCSQASRVRLAALKFPLFVRGFCLLQLSSFVVMTSPLPADFSDPTAEAASPVLADAAFTEAVQAPADNDV